ncbi:type II toxin-antitoxin system RelE family toxin [Modestobacter sp. VKM Ac-2984]|nr:type II toxin-antitoxin system RelE/ParE family toxin [Modestobacter sp. VKM Ac-2984]MCZ2816184.1 type II toxin-antitoxin system RelE/ParE family toxin [Modestobacter sp. VKM Ac-2984]
MADCWSARRGQYRVVYSVHDDEVPVRVLRISHRLTPTTEGPAW